MQGQQQRQRFTRAEIIGKINLIGAADATENKTAAELNTGVAVNKGGQQNKQDQFFHCIHEIYGKGLVDV